MQTSARHTASDALLHVDGAQVSLRLPDRGGVVRQPTGVPDHAADQAWWVLRAWRTRSASAAAAPLRPPDDAAREDPSHADLVAAGAALTRTYLDGPVGQALEDLLSRSPGPHPLGVHVAEASLKDLPWETLCHSGTGSPLALDPGVALYRAASPGTGHGLESIGQDVREGPLRMLAMIAAPEEDGFARLDIETEQQRLLDATDHDGRLELALLGEGSRHALRDALHGDAYDIVHLSCHGYENGLRLETGTGEAHPVSFERLIAAFPDHVPRPGLLVLSACASARGVTGPFTPRTDPSEPSRAQHSAQLPGLAERFASAGFPAVLAMAADVSDGYATSFAAHLYERLADDPTSSLPHTIARTRQVLEQRRRSAQPQALSVRPDRPRLPPPPAEWGTPSLYVAGRPTGLRTEAPTAGRTAAKPERTNETAAADSRVQVGRRRELQWLRREFWQAGKPVQVTGLGGTGKTALVEESLAREGAERHRITHLDDRMPAPEFLARMMRALGESVDPRAVEDLCDPGLPEAERVHRAREWFDAHDSVIPTTHRAPPATAPTPALLLLDARTPSATSPSPGAHADTEACLRNAFLKAWTGSGNGAHRRLLITSRSPQSLNPRSVPMPWRGGDEHAMPTLRLDPLSQAEARYLARRIPGLRVLRAQDLDRLTDALGGHPRALAFAACLLHASAQAASPDTWPRLTAVLHARGVSDPDQHVRSVAAEGLGAVLREAAVTAAEDADLPVLWTRLHPDSRSALIAAAVFRTPVPAEAFLSSGTSPADMAAAMRRGHPAPLGPYRAVRAEVLGELVEAGLLTPSTTSQPDTDQHFLVPRWISTYLAELASQMREFAHRGATAHWFGRLGDGDLETPADLSSANEAKYHAGQAGMTDAFIGVTGLLCRRHFAAGRFGRVRALSREVLTMVPPQSLLAADAYEGIGDCDHETGQVAAAAKAHGRALAIRRQAGDRPAIVQSLHRLALAETYQSHYELADAHFQEALSLSEQLGDREEMGRLHHSLALRADRRGELAAKKWHLDRADELRGDAGGRRSRAARLTERGRLAIDEGRYTDALRCFEQALDHDREQPADLHGIAGTTLLVADVYLRLERPLDLKAHAREALVLNERIGDTDGMLRAYTYLVYAALMEKDVTTAHHLAQHQLTLAESSGDVEDHELALNLLAVVARDAGDLDVATDHWSACRASAQRRGARDAEGRYLHHLGVVAYLNEDLDGARRLLEQAGHVLSEAGADAGAAESLCALARVLLTLAERTDRPHLLDDSLRALADATLHLNQPDTQNAQLTRNRSVYADLIRHLGRPATAARIHAFVAANEARTVLALLDP